MLHLLHTDSVKIVQLKLHAYGVAGSVASTERRVNLSVLVFNCLHNLAPSYLSTMCQPAVADLT